MTQGHSDRSPEHVETLIDEMSNESFPASDPPQLQGFERDGEPARNAVPPVVPTHARPPDVGPLHAGERSPFDREGRYALANGRVVTLRTEGDHVRIGLGDNPLTLDAVSLEALIALLERHRPSLHARR